METTCWTMIRAAAQGSAADRESFVRCYGSVLRAYLERRWRALDRRQDVDDALQEVFLECFRDGGALDRARQDRGGGFRAFLFGVASKVALRAESRWARRAVQISSSMDVGDVDSDETSLSQAFDRAWARALLKQAAELQAARALEKGEAARRRVEILRLRFVEDLPIRDIAERWGMTAEALYQEQFRARKEFKETLLEVVAAHGGGTEDELERECQRLQDLLG